MGAKIFISRRQNAFLVASWQQFLERAWGSPRAADLAVELFSKNGKKTRFSTFFAPSFLRFLKCRGGSFLVWIRLFFFECENTSAFPVNCGGIYCRNPTSSSGAICSSAALFTTPWMVLMIGGAPTIEISTFIKVRSHNGD